MNTAKQPIRFVFGTYRLSGLILKDAVAQAAAAVAPRTLLIDGAFKYVCIHIQYRCSATRLPRNVLLLMNINWTVTCVSTVNFSVK